MHTRKTVPFFLLLLFLLMLRSPETMLAGASKGLILWYQSALPSLFPFFVLTGLLIHTGTIFVINQLAGTFLCKLFCISRQAVFPVICGYLCGFPMGAKISSDLTEKDLLSSSEGEYLLSFCNNASPAFVAGYACSRCLHLPALAIPSFFLLTGSSFFCSLFFRRFYHQEKNLSSSAGYADSTSQNMSFASALDQSILSASDSIIKIGGYIIVFSVLLEFLSQLFKQKNVQTVVFLSLIELTNGVQMIARLPLSDQTRFVLTMAVTSFGGFCAIFQTQSMILSRNWSILRYITEKLVTSAVTSLFTLLYVKLFFS